MKPKILTPEEEKALEARRASADCAPALGSAMGEIMMIEYQIKLAVAELRQNEGRLLLAAKRLEGIRQQLSPNAKLTDDEERANDARIGT